MTRGSDRATITRLGENYQLRFERRLAHPRPRVWQAVASETGLGEWFPAAPAWDFRVGGRIDFHFPPEVAGTGMANPPGTITAIDEPHTFAFLWGTELLRFELLEIDVNRHPGTLLVFNHTLNSAEKPDAAKFAAGWQVCFEVLDHIISGARPPRPERWQIAYALYTDDFAVPAL